MYFSRLKAAAILGVCLLGLLVSLPNVFPRRHPGCRGAPCILASTSKAAAIC